MQHYTSLTEIIGFPLPLPYCYFITKLVQLYQKEQTQTKHQTNRHASNTQQLRHNL